MGKNISGPSTSTTPLRRRAKPERKRPPCRVGRNETAAAAQEWTVSFHVSIVFRFCSSFSAASSYFLPASGPGGYAETHYLHRNRSNRFTVGIIVLNFGTMVTGILPLYFFFLIPLCLRRRFKYHFAPSQLRRGTCEKHYLRSLPPLPLPALPLSSTPLQPPACCKCCNYCVRGRATGPADSGCERS